MVLRSALFKKAVGASEYYLLFRFPAFFYWSSMERWCFPISRILSSPLSGNRFSLWLALLHMQKKEDTKPLA